MSRAAAYAHAATGLSGRALKAALDRADARCSDRGVQLTSSRRQVLARLLAAGTPLRAYELMAMYDFAGGVPNPVAIYRALNFLVRQGLAQKVVSINAFVASTTPAGGPDVTLICAGCGGVDHVGPDVATRIGEASAGRGFTLTHLTLEAHGLCQRCSIAHPLEVSA